MIGRPGGGRSRGLGHLSHQSQGGREAGGQMEPLRAVLGHSDLVLLKGISVGVFQKP